MNGKNFRLTGRQRFLSGNPLKYCDPMGLTDMLVPDVSANDLQVEGSIDFKGDENLWNEFKEAYGENDK